MLWNLYGLRYARKISSIETFTLPSERKTYTEQGKDRQETLAFSQWPRFRHAVDLAVFITPPVPCRRRDCQALLAICPDSNSLPNILLCYFLGYLAETCPGYRGELSQLAQACVSMHFLYPVISVRGGKYKSWKVSLVSENLHTEKTSVCDPRQLLDVHSFGNKQT